jgi:hypothetical protein
VPAIASRIFGAWRLLELTFEPLNLRTGLIYFRLELNALAIRLRELRAETGSLFLKFCDLRFA